MVLDDLNEIASRRNCASRKKYRHPLLHGGGLHVVQRQRRSKESLEKAVKEAGLGERGRGARGGLHEAVLPGPAGQVDSARRDRRDATGRAALPESHARRCGIARRHAQGRQDARCSVGDPKHPFFTEQMSIVLDNSGVVDPERIESYIAADGYQALHDVLREMTPQEVLDAMIKSGLRGRGGAGYPTGLKWATVAKTASTAEVRHLQRRRGRSRRVHGPQRAGERSAPRARRHGHRRPTRWAPSQGFIYVRAEYPLAISRLQTAIRQAKQHGPAGQRHL